MSIQKPTLGDSKSSKAAPLAKNNSLTNESTFVPPRPAPPKPGGVKPQVGSPARRSMAPQSFRNPTHKTSYQTQQ
ncbi:hypothetical protein J4Q44_G00156630 [Coregonus suidteri]|uniref:Uncharacterized protein n=1 Tax=Coregonus suidteri TaxID=861788 RepID=A0AAN8LPW2_9TELE